jgi:2-polyprenyl-6-methoxyphenol hydroxylase-like FAD-dependent oxidoreductase
MVLAMATDLASHPDVIVVGARCAGAPTAMLLARAGFDVLLLERASLPSDTLSTHAIARSGVVQLDRWGLLDQVVASGAPPLRDVWFCADGERTHRQVKDRFGVDHLVAPRRLVLDAILARAAVEAGATLRTGVTVTGVVRDDAGRVAGVEVRSDGGTTVTPARLVIGADGLRSKIGREVGAQVRVSAPASGAAHYAYHRGDWDGLEYHLHDGAFSGIFPTHDGEACTWVCAPSERAEEIRRAAPTPDAAFDRMLRELAPSLAERLEGTARTSGVRGAIGLPNHLRAAAGPGWALVGDAGYHRDPVTGLGMSDAFRDADLLASALAEASAGATDRDLDGATARYDRQREARALPLFDLTVAMAAFPPVEEMRDLQRRLAAAIDEEAAHVSGAASARLAVPA